MERARSSTATCRCRRFIAALLFLYFQNYGNIIELSSRNCDAGRLLPPARLPARLKRRKRGNAMPAWKAFLGELISECVAMFIIITLGCSVAAMYSLYDPSPYQNAYWGVCIAWGLAVTIAIYVTGAVSGTHANPAVTLALAVWRGFPKKKILPFMGAQILGAFLGAAVVYLLFAPVIDHYNTLHHLTRMGDGGSAGVLFTHPGLAITPIHAFMDEIVLTAILLLGIFAVTEEFNTMAPMANSGALIIGLLVATIGASAGYLEAWAINPARD